MISRGKEEKRQARSKRLSAALRENLKRRKQQARGRVCSRDGDEDAAPAGQTRSQSPSPDFRRNRGRD
jgi:hypothetical protein